MLDKYMKQFAADLELETNFATQTPGLFSIPLEKNYSIELKELFPSGVSIRSTIGKCPQDEEDLLREALLANLFGQGTDGAVFAIDGQEENFVLIREMEYLPDYKEFSIILEDFMNIADFWREEFKLSS